MGNSEKLSNNWFDNGMVRHLNNHTIYNHVGLGNLWGGTLNCLYIYENSVKYRLMLILLEQMMLS